MMVGILESAVKLTKGELRDETQANQRCTSSRVDDWITTMYGYLLGERGLRVEYSLFTG